MFIGVTSIIKKVPLSQFFLFVQGLWKQSIKDDINMLQCRFWDQISGADVTVFDPSSTGTSGGKVVISGTPDQTFAAQSLLQAFIQTAQAS